VGSLIICVMALSIVLLMAASYAICYTDAFSPPDSLGCNPSGNSTSVM